MVFAQTSFTGHWTLNSSKSNFKNFADEQNAAPTTIDIAQTTDSIGFTRIYSDGHKRTETSPENGQPKVFDLSNASAKISKTVYVTWNENQTQFTLQSKYHVQDGREWDYERLEIYKLSPDGKELTIDRNTVLPDRTQAVTLVYDKAQ